jgi:hypothetical protein
MFTVGRLVGSCSPATDNDGHATKRPSTFFEHRRRLIQPTRKPTDLTNPSTESDQVHTRTVAPSHCTFPSLSRLSGEHVSLAPERDRVRDMRQ